MAQHVIIPPIKTPFISVLQHPAPVAECISQAHIFPPIVRMLTK